MIMALGGSFNVTEFRYLPSTFTRCTSYEVFVAPLNNGAWGPAVAMGTWGTDSAKKMASFPAKEGAFLRVLYGNPYCYAAEHNVVGAAIVAANLDPIITGGADRTAFLINGSSGLLNFVTPPPDFETPADAGGNNVYDVTVQVDDGQGPGGQATQDLAVMVTDVGDTQDGGGAAHSSLATDHANLATQIGAVSTTGEMSAQHDMLKTEHEDTQTAIAEVKTLVEALTLGAAAPPCGAGTEGQRFVADGTEVCDNTRGLYWDQNPDATTRTHATALPHCATLDLSNSQTCRLPEGSDLTRLLDYSQSAPALPAGHPFVNVQSADFYWSATSVVFTPAAAWYVFFNGGGVGANNKAFINFVWCACSGL